MYVCQSVSWLTFLLKLDKYGDISCSWWDIFLKFFGDILEMFVHYFKIITYFLYVCQSISWLTFLQILGKYRDISCSWWDIFLKFFGDIPRIFPDNLQIISNFLYVCQSISWLTSLLKLGQYRDISCSGWDIFQKFWGDIPSFFNDISKQIQIVCMSVSLLISLLPYRY